VDTEKGDETSNCCVLRVATVDGGENSVSNSCIVEGVGLGQKNGAGLFGGLTTRPGWAALPAVGRSCGHDSSIWVPSWFTSNREGCDGVSVRRGSGAGRAAKGGRDHEDGHSRDGHSPSYLPWLVRVDALIGKPARLDLARHTSFLAAWREGLSPHEAVADAKIARMPNACHAGGCAGASNLGLAGLNLHCSAERLQPCADASPRNIRGRKSTRCTG
jgi:hypothetical protein